MAWLPFALRVGDLRPRLSHDGLRWRVFTRAARRLPRVPFVLVLVPGITSLATMLAIAALALGAVAGGTLLLVALSRVDLEADAAGVRLSRRFRPPVYFRWSEVRRVEWTERQLRIVGLERAFTVDVPSSQAAAGARVGAWLEQARQSSRAGPDEPVPAELRRLVALETARSIRRDAADADVTPTSPRS